MTRYYFHIRDGWDVISDDEGMECSSWGAAWTEAYASADDMAAAATRDGLPWYAGAIEIADQAGNVLGRVAVPVRRLG
jgi:hypothetical protein